MRATVHDVTYPLEHTDFPYPLACEMGCGREATHEVIIADPLGNALVDVCGRCLERTFHVERRD